MSPGRPKKSTYPANKYKKNSKFSQRKYQKHYHPDCEQNRKTKNNPVGYLTDTSIVIDNEISKLRSLKYQSKKQ